MAKLISLQGATITFTNRLTVKKIEEFFNSNSDILFGSAEDSYTVSMLVLNGSAVYNNNFETSLTSFYLVKEVDSTSFYASVESVNGSAENILIINSNTGFHNIDTKFSNLTNISNDFYEELISAGIVIDEKIKSLMTYQPFISFIQDVCDVEGGVWGEEEQLDTFLTEIGDAIREVKGTTSLINARDMAGIVRGMSGGENLTTELSEYDELNSELEDVINSLPEAGGGSGNLETCTLNLDLHITPMGPMEPGMELDSYDFEISYITGSSEFVKRTITVDTDQTLSISVAKNNMIYMETNYLCYIEAGGFEDSFENLAQFRDHVYEKLYQVKRVIEDGTLCVTVGM